jgi:ribosomal protein S18 acetylase RimI-like enzyme
VADAIRPAARADTPALGRLGALLVTEHHAFDPHRFLAARKGTAEGYGGFLASQLDHPDVVILVAEDGGSVIGYAYAAVEGVDYMSLRGPAAVLHDLIVAPEHRSRGVGGRLMEAMFAELAARGAPRVVLSTAFRNEPAQRLFERMGFRRTMVEMTRELEAGGT